LVNPSQNPAPIQPANRLLACAKLLPFLAWFLLYLFVFAQVALLAVNVPCDDEWDEVPRHPLLQWLVAPHNEHRILTTKLLIYALWRLDGWNFAVHQTINFLIFGGLTLSVVTVSRKLQPDLPAWVLFAFCLFTLAPVDIENHTWGFQTQWHLVILFLIWSVYLLFDPRQDFKRILGGALCGLGCIYSLATGVPAMALTLLAFATFKATRFLRAQKTLEKRTEAKDLALVAAILGAGFVTYKLGFASGQVPQLPISGVYWEFLLGLILNGFCAPQYVSWGIACLAIYLAPILLEFLANGLKSRPAMLWPVLLLPTCMLASLAGIAAGRCLLGVPQAFASRYSEFTLIAIPLLAAALWASFRAHPWLRATALGAFWLFCAAMYIPHWQDLSLGPQGLFVQIHKSREVDLEQLHQCYIHGQVCNSPIHESPVTMDMFRQADALHLSFMEYVKHGAPDEKK